MWIVKNILQDIVLKFFKLYYKFFRCAGILFIFLIIECIILWCYRGDEIGIANLQEGSIVITDVTLNENLDFELTVENRGSVGENLYSVRTSDQDGGYIDNETKAIYADIDYWAGTNDDVCIPAGTSVKIKGTLNNDFIEYADVEKILFRVDWSEDGQIYEVELPK